MVGDVVGDVAADMATPAVAGTGRAEGVKQTTRLAPGGALLRFEDLHIQLPELVCAYRSPLMRIGGING